MTFSPLDSALLGPLFTTSEMSAVFSDEALLGAMVQTEAALARAQADIALADAIEAAGATLHPEALGAATALSGVPTIPFVKAMQARLPEALAPAFHRGATTQDVFDTALVLCMRNGLALIELELRAVLAALMRLAAKHRNTPCVGRTYGQHAAPITFGFKAAIWLTGVAEILEALPELRRRLLVASLGGPVGTLAGLGAQGPSTLEAYAAALGLGTTPLAWHTLRGRAAEAGGWLARLVGALAKIATDVASLASTEIGEVSEPHSPGRGGSSSMPHKRNPVSSTVILAAHATAPGLAAAMVSSMAAAHERPAGAWHAEWHALPPLFGLASGALREARALAEGMTIDAVRMRANLELTRGMLFADSAASHLAPSLGRAAAHELVEHAADEVRATGVSLQEILERHCDATASLGAAFDLAPASASAGLWVDRALAFAASVDAQ